MPLDGQSFYSEDFYGLGFYSYEEPIHDIYFEAGVSISFYPSADLRKFEGLVTQVSIPLYASADLGKFEGLATQVSISFYADADLRGSIATRFAADAVFWFNTQDSLAIEKPFEGSTYIPFYADSNEFLGYPWNPDVPIGGNWIPITVTGNWEPLIAAKGPWIPIGPSTRPNDG